MAVQGSPELYRVSNINAVRKMARARRGSRCSRAEKSTLPPARFGMQHSASPSHPTQQASTCRMQRRAAPPGTRKQLAVKATPLLDRTGPDHGAWLPDPKILPRNHVTKRDLFSEMGEEWQGNRSMADGCGVPSPTMPGWRPSVRAWHWHLASRLSLARQVSPALSLPLRALALLLLLLHATLDSDGFFPNSHAGNGAGGRCSLFFYPP
jgi:hypothetical protein